MKRRYILPSVMEKESNEFKQLRSILIDREAEKARLRKNRSRELKLTYAVAVVAIIIFCVVVFGGGAI